MCSFCGKVDHPHQHYPGLQEAIHQQAEEIARVQMERYQATQGQGQGERVFQSGPPTRGPDQRSAEGGGQEREVKKVPKEPPLGNRKGRPLEQGGNTTTALQWTWR